MLIPLLWMWEKVSRPLKNKFYPNVYSEKISKKILIPISYFSKNDILSSISVIFSQKKELKCNISTINNHYKNNKIYIPVMYYTRDMYRINQRINPKYLKILLEI